MTGEVRLTILAIQQKYNNTNKYPNNNLYTIIQTLLNNTKNTTKMQKKILAIVELFSFQYLVPGYRPPAFNIINTNRNIMIYILVFLSVDGPNTIYGGRQCIIYYVPSTFTNHMGIHILV